MDYVDSEILAKIELVKDAVNRRSLLSRPDSGVAHDEVVRAEEIVCLRSRELFSKYIDNVLWSGDSPSGLIDEVRKTLTEARGCLTFDKRCQKSVQNRLEEFETFCQKNKFLQRTNPV